MALFVAGAPTWMTGKLLWNRYELAAWRTRAYRHVYRRWIFLMALRIALFGNMSVSHEDRPVAICLARKPQALFAYLILHRDRLHPREELMEVFWPDRPSAQARRSLNTTLWRLRRSFAADSDMTGSGLVGDRSGALGFRLPPDTWLDVDIFERALHRPGAAAITASDAATLDGAVRVYRGDLIAGLYDDWVIRHRERLRCVYLSVSTCLMHYHAHHRRHEQSIEFGRRILVEDPIREDAHRAIMSAYAERGLRAESIRQYQQCQRDLAAELGIAPLPETTDLYERIVRGETPGPNTVAEHPPQSDEDRLNQAVQSIERAREELAIALPLLDAYRVRSARG